jgi:hypothetical protein
VASTNLKVPGIASGDYTLLAIVYESDNYNQGSGEAVFKVSEDAKIATKIESKNVVMYYHDGTRIYATLKDLDGNPLADKAVTFTINGVSSDRTTDSNGQISAALNLNSNNYTASFAFKGDSKYAPSQANASVVIKSSLVANDINMMYKDGTRYYVAILVNNKPVADEEIILNINGVLYGRTTSATGTASIAINLPANNYTVTAERTSTGEKISSEIVVNSLLVENKNVKLFYKNGTGYTVKVIKQDGKVAGEGEVVSFNINGVFYNRTTNASGIARLNLNLEPNDYIITAEYKDCRVSNSIKVLPVLSASDLTKKFGQPKAFEAKLVDGHGNPLANTNVSFNINGVFYLRSTDESGIARLNINLMAGKYIITSSYNGANIANTVTVTS